MDHEYTRGFVEMTGLNKSELENMIKHAVEGYVVAASDYRVTPKNRPLDPALDIQDTMHEKKLSRNFQYISKNHGRG